MIHENVPQYVVDAAGKGEMCEVMRITVRNNVVTQSVKVPIAGKLALKIFSTPPLERKGLYSRIRPIGENSLEKQPVITASILSDEDLRIEMEKRGLLAEKPKAGRPKKEVAETEQIDPVSNSLLSDPTLTESENA